MKGEKREGEGEQTHRVICVVEHGDLAPLVQLAQRLADRDLALRPRVEVFEWALYRKHLLSAICQT